MRLLYERYGRLVHSVAQRVCRDNSLTEEVVQEAFLTLWRKFSRYDPARGTFPAWLLTVVHPKAVDAVRREHPARRIHQTAWSWGPAAPDAAPPATGRASRYGLTGLPARDALSSPL